MSHDLMKVSEAEKLGYSKSLMHCGPSSSGEIIRMGKLDMNFNCLQFIDVKPDAVDEATKS